MGFIDKYTTDIKETKKTLVTNDTYAICVLLEQLIQAVQRKK